MSSAGLVRPWWERDAVPCRDAAVPQAGSGCIEHTLTSTECETVMEGGEPVRKCLKLYRRYINCAGSPVKEEEQKQEVVARGEGAQQLEPHLVELPSRLVGGASQGAPLAGPGPGSIETAAAATRMEDVVNSMEQFLRWAEELQEEMEPGMVHLDQVPAAAARPFSEGGNTQAQGAQPSGRADQQQLADAPLGWLGGLLFGRRRAEQRQQQQRQQQQQQVAPSTWKEFEKDFTEV